MNRTDVSPRVLVVVVTHNGREWLPHCLEAISELDYPAFDTVVVDSGSQARVASLVERLLPEAEFARLDTNVGFGAAANHALECSEQAPGADYYLFLHDDVVVEPDCLTRLVEAALASEAAVCGGKGLAWDQPDLLLEAGMSADQLGFPYTDLETGEIDQGQHDRRREVLFVTNACILVARALIERVGSWDGGYFAFGEDLDLCIRGRLAGFKVVFEPEARFRHAVALATGSRQAEVEAVRFYTRRNRLRTIAKTAAAYRLWAVLLLFLVVVAAEIFLLASLRRFEEIRAYPRALWSFLKSLPDVLRRRRAVQKRRTVGDRRIRRLMVSDLHRARVFAERRLREWEVGTVRFGESVFARLHPDALKATLVNWIRRPATLRVGAVVALLAFAARKVLFASPIAAGGIWPFPERARTLFTDYFAPWRDVALGSSSATPPALPLLGLAGAASLGSPGFAQFILIALALSVGLAGMYRLVARRTNRVSARVVALAVYALGPVTELAVSGADLGALALFAGIPFVLEIGLRMLGATPSEEGDRAPTPATVDAMVQDAARLALVSLVVVALAPSGYLVLVLLWAVASIQSYAVAWDRREILNRAGWLARSLVATPVLLLPWTIEAFRPRGAILGPIFSGRGGGEAYGALWSRFEFADMLFLFPHGGIAAALGVGTIVIGSVALAPASRRRESRMAASVVIVFAAAGGLVARGWLPAPVVSASMWLVVPLAAVSLLVGHLVAGLAEELPRHALGKRQALAFAAIGAMVIGLGWGWGKELGGWGPAESTLAAPTGETSTALHSFFTSTAELSGDFRILWIGHTWADPVRSGLPRMGGIPFFITGPEGLSLRRIHGPPPAEGERRLAEIVEAMATRTLDHAGHLMGPMGIRFVVADARDEELMSSMDRQRDFKLEQSEIAVFRNLRWIPRAALVPAGLAEVAAGEAFDPQSLMLADWKGGRPIPERSETSFRGPLPRTRHAWVIVGDNHNSGWEARVGGKRLERSEAFGWANRFDLATDARGALSVSYSGRGPRFAWLALQGLLVAMAIAMARLRGLS